MATVRSDVEIEGVKSYFFAPLLNYILENEQKLIENEEVNPFAEFVLGLTGEFPKPADVHSILVGTNPKSLQIVAAIDLMILFGEEYQEIINKLSETLAGNGANHDVRSLKIISVNLLAFERELSTLVRKASIGKVEGSHLLNFLQTILVAKSDIERLNAFSSLCSADYDWDAYVFLKLFAKGSPDEIDEMKLIRENIIAKIGGKRGSLVDLWLNGRKVDPAVELVRNLNKPILEAIELVVPQIVENILAVIKKEDDASLVELAPLTSQLFYLIVRTVLSGEENAVEKILAKLPFQTRNIMFPGLARTVFKDSISLLSFFAPFFVETSQRRKSLVDLENNGTFEVLTNSWKRDAVTKLVIDYKAAISRDVFGVSLATQNGPQHCNFIIEFLNNYEGEMHVTWLSHAKRTEIANALKGETLNSQVAKEHIAKVVAALEKNEETPKSPEPKDPTPTIQEDLTQTIEVSVKEVQQPQVVATSTIEIQQVQAESEIQKPAVFVPEVQIEQVSSTNIDLGQDEIDATTSSSTPTLKSVRFASTDDISEKSLCEEVVPETINVVPGIIDPIQEPIIFVPVSPIKCAPVETASSNSLTSQFEAGDLPRPTSRFQTGGFEHASSSKFGKGFGGGGDSQPARSFGGGQPQRGGGGGYRGGYRN